jgi:hypothetical protein
MSAEPALFDENLEEMREKREDERMDAILRKIRQKKVPAHQILAELHQMDSSYEVFFPAVTQNDDQI